MRQQSSHANKTLLNSMLVFIAGSSYGFIVPVIKTAAGHGVFAASFLPLQYLIALIVLLIVMAATKTRWGRPRDFVPLVLLGIFTGGTSTCYYSAVALLPSSAALTLLFQYIWISVVIECVHRRKLPARSSVIAIVIVLVGTLFATGLMDGSAQALDPVGVVFGLASAVCYALFLYLSGTLGTDKSPVLRTTMLAIGGLVVTSLVNPMSYVESLPDVSIWPYAAALAFMGILFPTGLINLASPKLSAGMVSIMASSELPVGILAAWAIVGDTPTPLVLLGALLVLAGIFVKQVPDIMRRRSSSTG